MSRSLNLVLLPTLSFVLFTSSAKADWWQFKVGLAKSFGCKTSGCSDNSKSPDPVQRKKVALTFDDGPNEVTTPKVLEVLKKHEIKATFFVLGKNAKVYRSLIRRIVDEGHMVGSHSWSHPNFWTLSEGEIRSQILRTEQALLEAGVKPTYFRYPHGNSTASGNSLLRQRGYKITGWNVDTCDWGFSKQGVLSAQSNKICSGISQTVTSAPQYLLMKIQIQKGGIVLFHDTAHVTANNLDMILTELEQDGYEFVTLDNLEVFPLLNR